MRTAIQVKGQEEAARHRPRAESTSGRAVPSRVVVGVAVLLAVTLLALSGRGALEVAPGSSAASSAVASGNDAGGRARLTSAVVGAEGVRVTVGPVVAEPTGATPEPVPEAGEATAMRRVAVYLTLRNVGEKVATFTPLDVALRDDRGEVYAAYSREWSRTPALPGAALDSGEQVEGWRVFEVPARGLEFVLLYRSDAMASAVEACLPRLRSGVDEAPSESLAQKP